jgi:heme-degrading monooxygenase HmoA
MAANGYATLWTFNVQPDRKAEFEFHYGPEGTWVRLFRRAPGYIGSELLQDRTDAHRYVTIDRWESREAWQAFRQHFSAEYERLDREFEGMTTAEAQLGEFAPAGSPS